MRIESLSIVNFKNFEQVNLKFHSKINCFTGNNGVGKTNLLDAIYYLCMSKSFLGAADIYSIRRNESFMMLQGNFLKDQEQEEVICGLKTGQKKQLRRNKKEYARISDHIGLFPVVMISPNDIILIIEGNEERRKYINSVISQYDNTYLENLIDYNKLIGQRNKLLKEWKTGNTDERLLQVYDEQLAPLGEAIYKARNSFIKRLVPVFQKYYELVSGGIEKVNLEYISQLHQNSFADELLNLRSKDMMLKHTSVGIHRDDLALSIHSMPIKKIGSQGQQKSFLVALKMAQFEFLKEQKKLNPILLLDDIFDKFDQERVKNILDLVSGNAFGQIFITHTNETRLLQLMSENQDHFKLFRVKNNQVETINYA